MNSAAVFIGSFKLPRPGSPIAGRNKRSVSCPLDDPHSRDFAYFPRVYSLPLRRERSRYKLPISLGTEEDLNLCLRTVVTREGLEPSILALKVRCFIHLSYRINKKNGTRSVCLDLPATSIVTVHSSF